MATKTHRSDFLDIKPFSMNLLPTPKQDAFERSFPFKDDDNKNNNAGRNNVDESPLPDINKRLGQLRPSRELLEYYRTKIAEYDEEHEDVVSKLEEYKVTYEEQHKLQWELRQREEEIVELQKALSDMQVYLFQEREHVLRLYSENDRLKIRELEDKKKIQKLLSLSGAPESEISYFLKEPPARAIVEQKLPVKSHNIRELDGKHSRALVRKRTSPMPEKKKAAALAIEEKIRHDNEVLALQVESLQAQLEEQAKLAKEQADALIEDRRVKEEEAETRRQRDEEKIRVLTEKLHKTQDLLYESTKDFLEMRYQGRANERQWMASKDRLLRELDSCKEQLNITKETVVNVHTCDTRGHMEEEIKSLEYQLKQSQKLAEMYREQVIQLEDNFSRVKEEGEVTRDIFQDRSEKLSKRLQLMNTRYQELEKRRNLEVEGFKNDIKNLRKRLKDVERQLYKVTIGFADDIDLKRPEDVDLQILKCVRRKTGRSKEMVGELKNLKSKIYGLENDLKQL